MYGNAKNQHSLEEEQNVGRLAPPDLGAHYETAGIRAAWCFCDAGEKDQLQRQKLQKKTCMQHHSLYYQKAPKFSGVTGSSVHGDEVTEYPFGEENP